MKDRQYRLTFRVRDGRDGGQEADDLAIEIAERIAVELGARLVVVCELDPRTGETLPIYAGQPA